MIGISASPYSHDFTVRNMCILNSKSGISTNRAYNITIENVNIEDVNAIGLAGGYVSNKSRTQKLSDVKISNINGSELSYGIDIASFSDKVELHNIEVRNIRGQVDQRGLHISSYGSGEVKIDSFIANNNLSNSTFMNNSVLQIAPLNIDTEHYLRVEITDSVIYGNTQNHPGSMVLIHALNDTTFVRNCTFAGNSGGSSALTVKGNAVFENNIFWNPQLPYELTAYYSSTEGISGRLEFDNNCIRNGLSGIYNMSPSYDAGGNERVWDGDGDGIAVIDLGAYEYQPIASPYNLSAEQWNQQILLGWQMPDGARSLSGFRIYRNNQAYADILDPGCRLFRDYSPVNDTLSYYVVALYGVVESEPTNSVTVIVSGVANSDETMVPVISRVSVSPNPFSDIAVISYELAKQSEVELKLYNLKGQLVRILQQGSQSKGFQTLAWEGCDDSGRSVASGIYILQLFLDGKPHKTMKLVKW